MRIGVDLLWVKPGKNGGTESYVRNLLDGFQSYISDHTFVLFTSKDNAESFQKYNSRQFEMVICPVNTASFVKRVIWENIHFFKYTKKEKIDVWFFPVYSRPFFMGNVPTITVIHDLQSLHYPEYFSKIRNIYFKMAWKNDCKISQKIITISEFCKNDIVRNFAVNPEKVEVIYNPICMSGTVDFDSVSEKYGIKKNEYYYTVCSLAKHKNLITLLKAMKILRDRGYKYKLVISGVTVNAVNEVFDFISSNALDDLVVYTGFISNEERNTLYDNCRKFLFPSVFEGFGMPPIEAMIRGASTVTTRETSLLEVTEGKADYVHDPMDAEEWANLIENEGLAVEKETRNILLEKYSNKVISEEYIRALETVCK
ncbi:Glycosyltransferase involved in cell wall bisynthesis [Butyrivibrio proteoclasticus]|uniref:Glycosyltransferase involved in cell wall bisynthesis n=1 Tax=Butyrivibrio proteoclasticus TaxID=43305 RepID=A0A1I5PV29_9FIRM|nr:glycosyltransferase family 1 protein [Butyrivibrio proteoclasticus]SFP37865.1 Glycosyltransferase involved in cell wall bisynthesis [Butyrivibrio proteoclasticus]